MELFQIDPEGRLLISPDIDDWGPVESDAINIVIDLDDDLDIGVLQVPNQMLYIYDPIEDMPELLDLEKLHWVARMDAQLVKNGYRLLVHCDMGHNRSALVTGLILRYLGTGGDEVVALIRDKRQGALHDRTFADYVSCTEIHSLEFDSGAGS